MSGRPKNDVVESIFYVLMGLFLMIIGDNQQS